MATTSTSAPTAAPPLRVAVVGGGWAGLAAAVSVKSAGGRVTVFEASRHWGGRARSFLLQPRDSAPVPLDNGQHVLIGAYTRTLDLMRRVGVDPSEVLMRLPLSLRYPDGSGLTLPDCRPPWNVLRGLWGASGWRASDRLAFLLRALVWQAMGYRCKPHLTVAQLCQGLPQKVMDDFIELLCLSALNTPPERASATVFLTVLRDALVGGPGSADLLVPRQPLDDVWPKAAVAWLLSGVNPADLRLGNRVTSLNRTQTDVYESVLQSPAQWSVNGERFDRVVWAAYSAPPGHEGAQPSLAFECIATVYAWRTPASAWPPAAGDAPFLALHHQGPLAPAQFVFDRSRLGGPEHLVAFVVSASEPDARAVEAAVCRQAQQQLGWHIHPIKTIVEKQATFACTTTLMRPSPIMPNGLLLAGDHVEGPYPATLEGAMRSGWAAGQYAMGQCSPTAPGVAATDESLRQ